MKKRVLVPVALAWLLLFLSAPAGLAQGKTTTTIASDLHVGDIELTSESGFTGDLSNQGSFEVHGYVEYRVRIVNRSPAASHTVALTIPRLLGSGFYTSGAHYIRSLKRSVKIGPSST